MQTTYWCFVASAPQKSQVNNFIEVFLYNGGKYGFWFIMYNGFLFSKSYFFCFLFLSTPKSLFFVNFDGKIFESLIILWIIAIE